MTNRTFTKINKILRRNGWKKVAGILNTREKVKVARTNLEEATEEAFNEFARPICVNTKTIVLD